MWGACRLSEAERLCLFVCFQSQAKSIAEQKRFPFATDNDSTNEELGENPGWEHPATSARAVIGCRTESQVGGRARRLALPPEPERVTPALLRFCGCA